MPFTQFDQPEQWQHLGNGEVPCLSADAYRGDAAEAHLAWLDAGGRLLARCSLWWSQTPQLDGRRVGAVGHYAAADRAAGAALLEAACDELALVGCEIAVGPMDGNTWRSYRLIVERGQQPAFFLEPDAGDGWLADFEAARFTRLAGYRSSVCDDPARRDQTVMRIGHRLAARGVTLRTLARHRLDRELQAIHAVSAEAFQGALLYESISLAAMRRLYAGLLERIDPAFVLLAERRGEVVGYAFGLPDLCQAARGEPVDTVILKTLAVRPRRELAGLGAWLMQQFHDTVHGHGMRRVIHAMMHEQNQRIIALSERYAHPMRRYALLARPLQ